MVSSSWPVHRCLCSLPGVRAPHLPAGAAAPQHLPGEGTAWVSTALPTASPDFPQQISGFWNCEAEILCKFLEDYLGASTDQAFYSASAATVEPGTSDCSTLIAQTVAICLRSDHKTLPSILEVYFTTYLYLKGAQ